MDPETGDSVIDLTNPSFALDRQNGTLYAVWEDGRFSNFQYNDMAFSMSADGGLTWSTPIRVNQTPLNIPALNRQAFLPAIAVANDGTIAVSHYDFRFNDPAPGLPTDRWLVRCRPSLTKPASDLASWGSEVRLTDASFNLEAGKTTGGDVRIGEYYGLAAVGSDFVSTFTVVNQENLNTVVFRRISR
jgi:hypothetical protein